MTIQQRLVRVFSRIQKQAWDLWLDSMPPQMTSAQNLSDEAFLALFHHPQRPSGSGQRDALAARTALLQYYQDRSTPDWPGCPRLLIDLGVKVDQLSQQDLISLAEEILRYNLFPDTARPTLTAAGMIDWQVNPISDPAWLWRLNRHQWWPLLGLAYRQSGDERYASAFVNQLVDWIARNPPPPRQDERSPTWRLMEVGLRLRLSWIPAFALFSQSPIFTGEARWMMLRAIYDQARFLALFKTNRNHLLRESNGLAAVSIYFPEFKEAEVWQQCALNRLDRELTKQVNQDGSHIEVSTGYQWLVIDEFEETYDLLQAHGLSLPNEDLAAWLNKMYRMPAYIVRPDGSFPELNDGFLHWQYTRLAEAGEKFNWADLTFIGSQGKRGLLPETTSTAFHNGGLYVMRSDWTPKARYLLFDAGPYGGPHGHEDKLSLDVFAEGHPFIVDSGSYTYDSDDPWRAYFVSSVGHNTVLVDGQSQVRRWKKENLHPETISAVQAMWVSEANFDYVTSTYEDGYGHFKLHKPENAPMITDVIHRRYILFVKPDYWLLIDELQADQPHDYQLIFHTHPEMTAGIEAGKRVVLRAGKDQAQLHLIPADPAKVQVALSTGDEGAIPSWYSPGHYRKTPSTATIYVQSGQTSTRFVTLLCPYPAGQVAPQVTIEPLDLDSDHDQAYLVTTAHGCDYLMLSPDSQVKQFGPYSSTGLIAGVRVNQAGDIITRFEYKALDC